MQVAEHADRRVGEPVQFVDGERVWTDLPHHDPAAGRAKIDAPPTVSIAGQRRKAAGTPPSTGISRPVVSGRSPAVSAITAAAMCSGSTSRFSRVRCA